LPASPRLQPNAGRKRGLQHRDDFLDRGLDVHRLAFGHPTAAEIKNLPNQEACPGAGLHHPVETSAPIPKPNGSTGCGVNLANREKHFAFVSMLTPNPSIERTFQRLLRALWPAAHVER
jgi:hypothetical protein